MTSRDFGPNGPPQYQTSFDKFKPGPSSLGATATIVDMFLPVMNQNCKSLNSAADGWSLLAKTLDKYHESLTHRHDKLKPHWKREAADLFAAWVSNSTWSLNDWLHAANANASALRTLAKTIGGLQDHMQDLWTEFDEKCADAKKEEDKSWLTSWKKLGDDLTGTHPFDAVMETYTKRARQEVLEPLNNAYKDAFLASYAGGKFIGPTNADRPTKQQMADAMGTGVGAPPGLGPVPSAFRGAPPAAPKRPNPGAPPPLPELPQALPPALPPGLGPLVPPMPMPVAPIEPPAPTPPAPVAPMPLPPMLPPSLQAPTQSPTAPPMPPELGGVPTMPGLRSPVGTRPPLPGTEPDLGLSQGVPPAGPGQLGEPAGGRPSSPGMPRGLQGRGGVGEPEMPPGSGMRTPPQLSGRRGPDRPSRSSRPNGPAGDEESEPPPPGRGGPALPGRNGKGGGGPDDNRRPTRPGISGEDDPADPARLGSPRRLQGIRDTRPRFRPGSAEAEELPLRRMSMLDGRLGSAGEVAPESLESAEQALRPGLNGRGLSRRPEDEWDAARRTQRQDVRMEMPSIDFVGDTELFTPAAAGPAVIDRPEDSKPITPEKPALRAAQAAKGTG